MKEIDKFKYAQPYLYKDKKLKNDNIFYCFDSSLERKIKVMSLLNKKVIIGKQNIESLSDVIYILNIAKSTIYTNCECYTFLKKQFPGFYIDNINYYHYYFFNPIYLKSISNETVANIIKKTKQYREIAQKEYRKFRSIEDKRINNKLIQEKWSRKKKK